VHRVRDVRVGRIPAAVDDGRDEGQQKRHGLACSVNAGLRVYG
jgi:hypothetical protein